MTNDDGEPNPHARGCSQPLLHGNHDQRGARLAALLEHRRGQNPLVVAIAEGGLAIARELAARLDADLDLIVARRVGASAGSTLSLGAVTAGDMRVLNEQVIEELGLGETDIERLFTNEVVHAHALERKLRCGLPALDASGRTVILVDAGINTGATLRACVHALRRSRPRTLVVALPVAKAALQRARVPDVDEIVCAQPLVPAMTTAPGFETSSQFEC